MTRIFAAAALLVVVACAARAEQAPGWRVDGTGKFADAVPPIEWAKDKGVVWKTPLPAWSNASPVISGDKLFVLSEPATLICVNIKDGVVLWQKTENTFQDALTPEQKAQAAEEAKKAEPFRQKLNAKNKERDAAQQEMRKLREQKKNDPKVDDTAAKTKLDELNAECKALRDELNPLIRFSVPRTHDTNGYSSCTPVVDGANVYAIFGTGVVVAYDYDGNRKWIKLVERPAHDWGHSSSPVLSGGKLLIHVQNLFALAQRQARRSGGCRRKRAGARRWRRRSAMWMCW
jgi:hypothetical protein